jgi:hypothetical protein
LVAWLGANHQTTEILKGKGQGWRFSKKILPVLALKKAPLIIEESVFYKKVG